MIVEGATLDVLFATFFCYFLIFQNHFVDIINVLNDIFFLPMCLYASFEVLYSLV